MKIFKTGREYFSCIGLYKNNMFSLSPAKNIEILKNVILPYFTVYFYIGASRLVVFRQAGKPSRLVAPPVAGLLHPLSKLQVSFMHSGTSNDVVLKHCLELLDVLWVKQALKN